MLALLAATALSAALAAALAAAPADPDAEIRALRRDYNAAIAAHDMTPVRSLFDPDYHVIRGATGGMLAGPDATAAIIASDVAKDPGFIAYERLTDRVQVSTGGVKAAETGHWVGRWKEADGEMRLTGVYLAMWIHTDGKWTVKSEAYVALACTGSAECRRFAGLL